MSFRITNATTGSTGGWIVTSNSTWTSSATTTTIDPDNLSFKWNWSAVGIPDKIPAGKRTLELPDGSKLILDDNGNYRIEDKDAKVTYKANRLREFSPHLNASDLLAQFVRYVGSLGVRQGEVLGLPIELFINWLIIEAAQRDDDPVPVDVVRVEKHVAVLATCRPKCLSCGRFIPRFYHRNRFPFCRPEHGARYMQRQLAGGPLEEIADPRASDSQKTKGD